MARRRAGERTGDLLRLVKISDLARLSGVPTPTIKHYMREGLLPGPHKRTSRNMAYYDVRLAERVKVIKELQQDRFLPLKVIGDLLEDGPSAQIRGDLDEVQRRQLGALEPAVRAGNLEARRRREPSPGRKRTRAEVLRELRISEDDLAQLGALGLVQPSAFKGGDPVYTGADLDVLEVIDDTRGKGLGDVFPLSILEPYLVAIRALVRVELALFRQQALAGAAPPAVPLDEVARSATALAERLIVAMRSKLLIPELHAVASAPREVAAEGSAPVQAPAPTPPPRRGRGRIAG